MRHQFCYEGRVEQSSPATQAGLYGSILPAVWSFMLALRARGLGAAWTTLHLRYEQEAAQLLGLPASLTQAALLPVAYYTGDDFQPAKRTPTAERTYWNGWGSGAAIHEALRCMDAGASRLNVDASGLRPSRSPLGGRAAPQTPCN